MPTPIDAPLDSVKDPTHVVEERDNMRGILWMLVSVVVASIMTLAVRKVSLELSSVQVVLYRSTIAIVLVGSALLLATPLRKKLSFTKPMQHIVRGTLVAIATHFGFYTIATIPLATATVLFFTAPIFATLLAVIIHKETIGMRRILAIVAGFVGAVVVLRPGFSAVSLGMVTAIGSSLCFASALTMSRKLAQADGPLSTYYSSIVITALISVPIVGTDLAVPQLSVTWAALILVALTSMVRGVADIQAYSYAEASILAPVAYLRLVFIGVGAYLMFQETPDWQTILGAVIIIGSTLYIAQREAALRKRKRVKARGKRT
ncbi:MAG: DMT family transporter [Amylibacter sp.]|nr:DMT family transporter [Amylibacter sp.]